MDLNTIWFILVAVLLTGYAILDGFDLGVGILHLFARDEEERRAHLAAVGPFWDGNEVWLLTGGGALFAAFPVVYAKVFSGFYLALMLVLVALIARAVSLEFRATLDDPRWRRVWDFGFGIGSLLPALLFGVAVGNVLRGVPIDGQGNYGGTFFGLLNPYALVIGLVGLAFFIMHGALYLRMKTSGELAERLGRWASRAWVAFAVLFLGGAVATQLVVPHLIRGRLGNPLLLALVALLVAAAGYIPIANKRRKPVAAFLASSAVMLGMIGICAVSMYPRIVPSLTSLDYSLTIYNAASSPRTLGVMLVIALIGMPLVIAYTAIIYRVFRGKVTSTTGHYE